MGNSVCKEDLEQKHVVVIGGGYGGMELAAELLKLGIPFTLIDPKVTINIDNELYYFIKNISIYK